MDFIELSYLEMDDMNLFWIDIIFFMIHVYLKISLE